MSHFFAYMARMKYIRRWGLMRGTREENIQEHSLQTAQIAHALAVISLELGHDDLSPDAVATRALYHEAAEVMTGDLPTPVKYFNAALRQAYQGLEKQASERLLRMLPPSMQPAYAELLLPPEDRTAVLVKAADRICAYFKCVEEMSSGNREFADAQEATRAALLEMNLPEVKLFLERFEPSFHLTLDQMR